MCRGPTFGKADSSDFGKTGHLDDLLCFDCFLGEERPFLIKLKGGMR